MSLHARTWALRQPDCTKLRGWVTKPPSVAQFQALLATHHVLVQTWPSGPLGNAYVFTDGSVRHPKDPHLRLGGWAWIYAQELGDYLWLPGGLGSVPGLVQTSQRAELAALIDAISFGATTGTNLVVFCDSWNVVRKVKALQTGHLEVHPLMPDHDLWLQLQFLLSGSSQHFQIFHVYSHQALDKLHGLEHWVCQGNDFVDNAAQQSLPNFLKI